MLKKEFDSAKIDYGRFAEEITTDFDLMRVHYYHCLPYQSEIPTGQERQLFGKAQSFFRALQRTDKFEVKLGKLECRGRTTNKKRIFQQKRVDLMLGLDMTMVSSKRLISDLFLITGDSDLIPAVEVAKSEGVIVHLVHGSTAHDDLLDAADVRHPVTQELITRLASANPSEDGPDT